MFPIWSVLLVLLPLLLLILATAVVAALDLPPLFLLLLLLLSLQLPLATATAATLASSVLTHTYLEGLFKVFEVPRPSKKASEGARRLSRGYLRLFGDVLSHLGAILETRAFLIAPDCAC